MDKPLEMSTPTTGGCGCGPECCGGPEVREGRATLASEAEVREAVREKYGQVAVGVANSVGCCRGPTDAEAVLAQIGYSADQAAAVPEGANLGLGCGNPLAHAALAPGEVVLDLGSGGGIDCFLAARAVGPSGRAIGVDMTPAMVERARATAARHGITNAEFRLGEIEALPLRDASVDAVISNCVVNLSTRKPEVFAEALRVLRPGGRLVVSDLVLTRPLSPELQRDVALYVGCVSGASLREDYLAMIRGAGFTDLAVVEETGYTVGMDTLAADSPEREAFAAVVSVKVRAYKPAA
jgi:SAM-dependent methyltransferase